MASDTAGRSPPLKTATATATTNAEVNAAGRPERPVQPAVRA
jgi:hypothetical protein